MVTLIFLHETRLLLPSMNNFFAHLTVITVVYDLFVNLTYGTVFGVCIQYLFFIFTLLW